MKGSVPIEGPDERCVGLLSRYDGALRRLVAGYERDAERQEDVLQEIWLAVWQALPRYRGECSERTFVFRVAHNRVVSHVDYWRRRHTEPLDDDIDVAAPQPNPEQALSQQQRQERLREAVRALPLALRQIVILNLEGCSNAETADVVGITENNVAVRLTRARAALARSLGVTKEPA